MNQKSRLAARSVAVPLPNTGLASTLSAEIRKPKSIDEDDKAHMYLLMREYYAEVSETQFLNDLAEKNDVILLRDAAGNVKGFSTLLLKEMSGIYGNVLTVFSGDTVIAKEYWGRKELGVAFLKYLFIQKVKNPLTPVYWMLMSKGYKTYLLMANNFGNHFPRMEMKTPNEVQSLMHDFYSEKFGNAYSMSTGLIEPNGPKCRLREGVAAVTDELRQNVPRIDFFATKNPRWADGIELACTAEMTLFMPLYYFLKKTLFAGSKQRRSKG